MAKLDTRIISDAIPVGWLASSEPVEFPDLELQGETGEMPEQGMIVAFLANC